MFFGRVLGVNKLVWINCREVLKKHCFLKILRWWVIVFIIFIIINYLLYNIVFDVVVSALSRFWSSRVSTFVCRMKHNIYHRQYMFLRNSWIPEQCEHPMSILKEAVCDDKLYLTTSFKQDICSVQTTTIELPLCTINKSSTILRKLAAKKRWWWYWWWIWIPNQRIRSWGISVLF